jgi:hypothetical protein
MPRNQITILLALPKSKHYTYAIHHAVTVFVNFNGIWSLCLGGFLFRYLAYIRTTYIPRKYLIPRRSTAK